MKNSSASLLNLNITKNVNQSLNKTIKPSATKSNVSVHNRLIMNLNLLNILAVISISSASLKTDFIKDFLIKLKNVQHSVLFTCLDIQSTKYLARNLSESGVYFNFYNPNILDDMTDLPNILNWNLNAKCGVVLDTNCEGYSNVLQQSSYYKFFNRTYYWLIIDDSALETDDLFNSNLKEIGICSQITYAKKTNISYKLIDIYSKALQLRSPLIFEEFGLWDYHNGFNITKNLYPIYNRHNRGNFNGLTLRGITIIDKDNVLPEDVDALLSPSAISEGIEQSTKYYYALTKLLSENYNFKVKYRVSRTWAGILPSGYRLGVYGVIMRGEADIVAAGFWRRIDRFDNTDCYHQSWFFEYKQFDYKII